MKNQSYFIKGFPDYRLVRLSDRDFCVLSNKKGYWEEIGSDTYKDGHILVHLSSDNAKRATYLHVLVAEMFVPNPEGKTVVHHIDGDATNNDPSTNLMWVTPSEHGELHKKGEKNPMYGKQHTEEARRKVSDAERGEKHHMYGKHHSEETKRKNLLSQPSRKPVEQWSKDGKTLIARYASIAEAARQTGISSGAISACCKGKPHYNTAGGYIWRYAE